MPIGYLRIQTKEGFYHIHINGLEEFLWYDVPSGDLLKYMD